MLLTAAQLLEIKAIIEDAHNAVVVNYVSPDAVSPDTLERLKSLGLVDAQVETIKDAYLLGHTLAGVDLKERAGFTYRQLKEALRRTPIQLSEAERQAVQMANARAAQYVVGLGNRVGARFGDTMIEADAKLRQNLRDTIRTNTERNIAVRETVARLKSDLGHATGDWTRDLDRIAVTEKQTAMQEGLAASIAARDGGDAKVAKISAPDCCDTCRALTTGPDGRPKVFRLKDLEANGSNFGRRVSEWKVTISAIHPHCTCELIQVPEGFEFNARGQLMARKAETGRPTPHPMRLAIKAAPPTQGAPARPKAPLHPPPLPLRLG